MRKVMIEQRHITSSRPTGLTSDLPVERLLRDALETNNSRVTHFARESVRLIHRGVLISPNYRFASSGA